MIKLNKLTNFELPKVDTVKIILKEQSRPFSYIEVNFDISQKGSVMSSSLLNNYLRKGEADLSLIDVLDEIENKVLGNENDLFFGNFIFQIIVNNTIVEFSLSSNSVGDPIYYIKDIDGSNNPGEIPPKIKAKIDWYITLIAGYVSEQSDDFFMNTDTDLISADGDELVLEKVGEKSFLLDWIEKKTEKKFIREDYDEDELTEMLSVYVFNNIDIWVDQMREDIKEDGANEEIIDDLDDDFLSVFIPELIRRIISGTGNTFGTDKISTLAHDYLIYFDMNTTNNDGKKVIFDKFWSEDDNPEKEVLKHLSNNARLYEIFFGTMIDIWNFMIYLSESNDNYGDDMNPSFPIEM